MWNESLINELNLLLKETRDYENLVNQLAEINEDIESVKVSKNLPLEEFDKEYLPKYVRDKIGEAPKDFAWINPVKLIKPIADKKNKTLKKYSDNKKEATAQYYVEFAEQRNEIQQKSEMDFNKKISLLETVEKELSLKAEKLNNQIRCKGILPQRFLKSYYIKKMIKYLGEWRAESIKEAIAILCIEEDINQRFQEIDLRLTSLEKNINNFNNSIREEIKTKFDDINSSLNDMNDRLYDLKSD